MSRPNKYTDNEIIECGKKIAQEKQCSIEDVSSFAIQKHIGGALITIRKVWDPHKEKNRQEELEPDEQIIYPEVELEIKNILSGFDQLPKILSRLISQLVKNQVMELTQGLVKAKKAIQAKVDEATESYEILEEAYQKLETEFSKATNEITTLIEAKGVVEGRFEATRELIEGLENKNSALRDELSRVSQERDLANGQLMSVESEMKSMKATVKSLTMKNKRLLSSENNDD